jgi:hypothetical protein
VLSVDSASNAFIVGNKIKNLELPSTCPVDMARPRLKMTGSEVVSPSQHVEKLFDEYGIRGPDRQFRETRLTSLRILLQFPK